MKPSCGRGRSLPPSSWARRFPGRGGDADLDGGDTFVIIDKDGDDPVQGTFAGLPEESVCVLRPAAGRGVVRYFGTGAGGVFFGGGGTPIEK
jgi:hypothetical protein